MGNTPGLRELSELLSITKKALHCLAPPSNPGFLLILWSSEQSGKEGLCPLSQWMGHVILEQMWKAS